MSQKNYKKSLNHILKWIKKLESLMILYLKNTNFNNIKALYQ